MKLGANDPLQKQLDEAAKVDEIRKKIVATKEGGAITGEERIREKRCELYGAVGSMKGARLTTMLRGSIRWHMSARMWWTNSRPGPRGI